MIGDTARIALSIDVPRPSMPPISCGRTDLESVDDMSVVSSPRESAIGIWFRLNINSVGASAQPTIARAIRPTHATMSTSSRTRALMRPARKPCTITDSTPT